MTFYIIEPHFHYQQFSYYSTLAKEIVEREDARVSLDPNSIQSIPESMSKDNCIFLGLGFFDSKCYEKHYPNFLNTKALKIAYLHKVKNSYQEKINFCKSHKVDLILTSTPLEKEIQEDSGIRTCTLPYGADPNTFNIAPDVKKQYDISFSGAMHENKQGVPEELLNIRFKARDLIKERKDLSIFWNGSDDPSQSYRMSQPEYVKKLNQSKIWYAATGPAWDMNPRHSEILFCGAVLLTHETPSGYYDQWEDGFNCVRYKTCLLYTSDAADE